MYTDNGLQMERTAASWDRVVPALALNVFLINRTIFYKTDQAIGLFIISISILSVFLCLAINFCLSKKSKILIDKVLKSTDSYCIGISTLLIFLSVVVVIYSLVT